MKIVFTLLSLVTCGFFTAVSAQSSGNWPQKTISSNGTTIKMYEWQPESYTSGTLKARAAISITENGKSDPVFGVAWLEAEMQGSNNQLRVRSVRVNTVKLPGEQSQDHINSIQQALERDIPNWDISFTNDELNASLKQFERQENLAQTINNAPPEIIYSQQPSVLVSIDGNPKLQMNEEWGVEAVVNSPFTIIKNKDGNFYLYGGKNWYASNAATGPYAFIQDAPKNLKSIESAITESYKNNNTEEEKNSYTISSIIVTTKPAELIQTDGEAKFGAVEGTSLLYVRNSDDDIFMDVSSQNYYVLLSGRWYKSKTLSGNWQFVDADKLPSDFARIPENSEKGDVLASVAGTNQARNALQDAEIPQTAKVDRNSASVDVTYDGDPEFEDIDGTSMQYAINSPYSVIRYRNRYYAVDNGVWFESRSSRGPWVVAVARPAEIALIPPRYPVYHVKYVYIYDVYPDYVYMGYTPGYLNTYVYGPTVVYGTGFYYRPWFRNYYFPRPCTWGYNMRYSPWVGWGFGVNINFGWFNVGIGNRYWGYSRCGWWGPAAYRPNYCYRGNYFGYTGGGYRNGRNVFYANNTRITNINYNNNIYNNRRGVATRDNNRYTGNNRREWANNDRYNNRNRDFNNNNRFNNSNRDNNRFDNNNRNRDNNGRIGNNNNRGGNNGGFNNNNGNTDRRQRQYEPRNNDIPRRENRIDNNRGNGGNDNNRIREPQRRERQYQAPDNSNRGSGNRIERGDRGNSGGGAGRSVERRESNGGNRGQGGGQSNGQNNNNGGGRSGRRGG